NDLKWSTIRSENVPVLRQELRNLQEMAPDQTKFRAQLKDISETLTATHDEIFYFSNLGDFASAKSRAQEPEYITAKQELNGIISELRNSTQESLIQNKETSTILANTLTLGSVLFGMFLIHRRQMRKLEEDRRHFAKISENILQLRYENSNLASVTQEQLKKIDELAGVAEITSNMVMLKGADRRVRWVNNAFCQLTGYQPSEVEEKLFHFESLVTPELDEVLGKRDPAKAISETATKQDDLSTGRFDSRITTKKGSVVWLSMDRQRIVDDGGVTTGYILVGTDITLKKQHEIQIASYASDMKRFAHIASHDLKEPLRQIWDYLNVLQEADSVGDVELKTRCYDVMSKATNRGRNLVSDLLRFAKLQDRVLGKAFYPIEEILEPILEQLEVSEFRGNVTFTSEVPNVSVNADDALLQSVMQNLISNAVKYTAPDRPNAVHLGMENDGDTYRLFVTDTGIGFDAEKNRAIFEPFTRLVTKQEFAGSGIGLSIVSSIIQKHGWQIVANGEEGVGASFDIIIPASDVIKIVPETENREVAA
ncbi:MAG: PAS domain-containing sensor histidine kinase, partial [Hyphomicrobiales bacterium]